jgi:polysaccharide biosynthesis/export protein
MGYMNTSSRLGALLGGALLSGLLTACGSTPPSAALSNGAAIAPADEYIIGPGDRLQVFVWRNPDISATVPVRPDGRISTPLVEDMLAVGKTPSNLARDIEGVLNEYIRSPQVNVIVEGFVGTFGDRIRVVGQAGQPRTLPFRDRMTLLDVMIEVGGLTEFAAGNRARVVRQVEGGTEEIRVRLNDLLNRGDMRHNITMRPGDLLIIPESFF